MAHHAAGANLLNKTWKGQVQFALLLQFSPQRRAPSSYVLMLPQSVFNPLCLFGLTFSGPCKLDCLMTHGRGFVSLMLA